MPGRGAAGAGRLRPTRGAMRCAAAAAAARPGPAPRAPWVQCKRRVDPASRGTRGRGRPLPPQPLRERRAGDAPLRLGPLRSGAGEGAGTRGEQRPIEEQEGGLGAGRGRLGTPRVLKPACRRFSPAERLCAALCPPAPGALQPPRRPAWHFPAGLRGALRWPPAAVPLALPFGLG